MVPSTGRLLPRPSGLPLLLAALAGGVGFALTIWVYYPGLLSPDSLWQLTQARGRFYVDSHPPVMAWLWSKLNPLRTGPGEMLALQVGIFWLADLIFWLTLSPGALAAVGILLFGLLPPVFALIGTIWKDVQMGVALLGALALILLLMRGWVQRWILLPVFLLLGYATAVRFNGILAAVPMIWLAVSTSRPGRPRTEVLVLSAAAILAIFGLAFGANAFLTDRREYLSQQYQVHDLVAVSLDEGRSLFPAEYWGGREPVSLDRMGHLYHPVESLFLFWSASEGPHFPIIVSEHSAPPPPELAALRKAWIGAIWDHPARFLRYRLRTLEDLLGFGTAQVCKPYQPSMQDNSFGITLAWPRAHAFAFRFLDRVRDSLLFRGWFYLVILIGLFCESMRRPGSPARVALAASGLLNFGVYPLMGTGCDFRYLWWSVLAAWLGLILLVRARWGGSWEASNIRLEVPA
jgi:hypothetical protein